MARPDDVPSRHVEFFVTMVNPLQRLRSVPPDLFNAYWRDAHAQIACRLPGLHDLWLHELSYEDGRLWPAVEGIESDLPEEARFDGASEPRFLTEEDTKRFLAAKAHPHLLADEPVVFSDAAVCQSLGPNSKTFLDRLEDPAPNGDHRSTKFLLFFKAAAWVKQGQFRDYMSRRFAEVFASTGHVLKFRLHLFEDSAAGEGERFLRGSGRGRASDWRYQAAAEVAFRDGLEMGAFLQSVTWVASLSQQAAHIRVCHAFGVPHTHTLRHGGELTLAGLRTPAVADLIQRLRTVNQLAPEVAELFRGTSS